MKNVQTADTASKRGASLIIRVKFKRSPTVAEVRAVSYEADDTHLRAKDGNHEIIADFLLVEVAGWWVQQDAAAISLADRMREARERVERCEAENPCSTKP